jgi:hypothetical protein
VFGFKPKPTYVIPPTVDVTPQPNITGTIEEPTVTGVRPRTVSTVANTQTTNPCPTAAENAFPAQVAGFSVTSTPSVGRYRWKETVDQPLGDGKTVSTIVQFLTHDITNVSAVTTIANPVPPDVAPIIGTPSAPIRTFTYDDVIHNLDGSTTTTTYEVKENALNLVGGTLGLNPLGELPDNVSIGSLDRGLSILKVVTTSADGKSVSTFAPLTPVLLMPLDVVYPETFVSEGIAADGTTMTVDGNVLGRARVDACGTVIDGWQINSHQVFLSPSNLTPMIADDTYYVATQLGGILTYELKTLPPQLKTATTPTVIDSIGQLTPSPIPK